MPEIDLQALQAGVRHPPRLDGMRLVDPESTTSSRMDVRTQNARRLSGRPLAGDPRIPPPEPDGYTPKAKEGELETLVQEPSNAVIPPPQVAAPSALSARLVVSFGRKEGECIIGIERPPEWDLETSKVVSLSAVKELLPILKKLARLKDLTAELSDDS